MKQTLFYNGTILTMDRETKYAPALLVQDGRIAALGEADRLRSLAKAARAHTAPESAHPAASGTAALSKPDPDFFDRETDFLEQIDLENACLMPSFLDAHSHFSGYAMSLLQIPLEEAASFAEIRERITAYIDRNRIPAGQWVIAKGYDHNHLAEKRHPSLALLDSAAPDNPLVLQHQSSHMGVFNSCGLKVLGITPETPSPSGGLIQVADGKLTGYLEENAFIQYFQKLPTPSMSEMLEVYLTAQDRYASYGITTVQEGMFVDQLLPFYQYLLQTNSLKLDLAAYVDARQIDRLEHALPWRTDRYCRHLKLGGLKIFLDGSPQGRTAWMREPYAGTPDYTGYPALSDEQVLAFVRLAVSKKLQLLAHCNGDAAAAQYLNAIACATQAPGPNGAVKNPGTLRDSFCPGQMPAFGPLLPAIKALRPVIVHAQLLGTDQLDAVRQAGLIPSFFAAHVYHWGDVHLKNFGYARASHLSPAASAQKHGIPFTFHQDAPVIEPDMLETVWCAANRLTKAGVSLREEAISTEDALRAVTANAAYQYFEEQTKGTLAPGKLADLCILSQNPLDVPKEALRDIRVLATFKEGSCIYHV